MAEAGFFPDVAFEALAAGGRAVIYPQGSTAIQAASLDLTLSGDQYKYTKPTYRLGDPIAEDDYQRSTFVELTVGPQETVFVGLAERMTIPRDAVGFVFARSSLTRLGLRVAPVFMNPGYSGRLPLTITNSSAISITLVKGVRVAQVACATLSAVARRTYEGPDAKYAGEDFSPSRIHADTDIKAALERVLKGYFPEEEVRSVVG